MLIDELREQLKQASPNLHAIDTFWQNNNFDDTYSKLSSIINQPDFWQHKDQIALSKRYQMLKDLRARYNDIRNSFSDHEELLELFSQDEAELERIKPELTRLCKEITSLKLELLLSEEEDQKNCFMSINAGAGGTESQDWAEMLLRMYVRFCEREGLRVAILDYQAGEEAGIKSAMLFIKGKNAYGLVKGEIGVHRLVRISPFDSNKRRHTSFAAVTATPETIDKKIVINDDELRIDTYRAGGAGGQHVNKTDSAVRTTHLPTGIVAQCQNERSQLQNKQTALKVLMARLVERQEEEKKEREGSVEKKKIEWGSQIRSYVLHPYKMVKDHRTNYESPQPDLVLDGDLMPFIEDYLLSTKKL